MRHLSKPAPAFHRQILRLSLLASLGAAADGQTNRIQAPPVLPLVAQAELKKFTAPIEHPLEKTSATSVAAEKPTGRSAESVQVRFEAIPQSAMSAHGRELSQTNTHIDLTTQRAQLDEFRRADRPIYLVRPETPSKPPAGFGRFLSGLFSAATSHMQPIGPAPVAPDGKVQ